MHLPCPAILVPTFFALSTFAVAHPAAAQVPLVFVIAASEGYGVGDCLTNGGSCGQIIADAWCVAHGTTHAVSYGPAANFARTAERPDAPTSPGSLVISCGE